MKAIFGVFLLLAITCVVYGSTSRRRASADPCQAARRQQSQSQASSQQYCGNNGVIFPSLDAFNCAKKTNANLRQISCNDSIVLAKNALRNIQEQNRNGDLLTQREKIQRMRQRHEQAQRDRELQQQQQRSRN